MRQRRNLGILIVRKCPEICGAFVQHWRRVRVQEGTHEKKGREVFIELELWGI
jgi:hypothetical protein